MFSQRSKRVGAGLRLAPFAILVLLQADPAAAKPRLSVQMDAVSRRTVVRVSGVPASKVQRALTAPNADERLFYLAVAPPPRKAAIPILATSAVTGPETVDLTASTSLTPGVNYVAEFNGPLIEASLPRLTLRFSVPKQTGASTAKVAAIYPTQDRLPANLLKFYVRFSAPMGQGQTFRHVRLLDANRKPIAQAFRERELWSENHRRLTLWINPGRTKKALGLSESLGPVLMPDREYFLEIGGGLKDQSGLPLGKPVLKRFRTLAADKKQPKVTEWKLDLPSPGTREALRVRFPEPMDRALAERAIAVQHSGAAVAGTRQVSSDCRTWQFTPAAAWKPGDHRLLAAGELEDLAGNSLYRAFETHSGTLPATAPPTFERAFKLK